MSFSGLNLAANATTLVKENNGILHSISINKIGASANTLKFYDGLDATSGTITRDNRHQHRCSSLQDIGYRLSKRFDDCYCYRDCC